MQIDNDDGTKMLTTGEADCRLLLESVGVDYNIVFTVTEALEVIGAI